MGEGSEEREAGLQLLRVISVHILCGRPHFGDRTSSLYGMGFVMHSMRRRGKWRANSAGDEYVVWWISKDTGQQ